MKAYIYIDSNTNIVNDLEQLTGYISKTEWNRITRHSHTRGKKESLSIRLALLKICQEIGLSIEPFPVTYLNSGKPILVHHEWFMSWSHAKGVSAAVIAPCSVGIDVETDRMIAKGMFSKSLHPHEEEEIIQKDTDVHDYLFVQKWVLKEAYLKMAGLTIANNMNSIQVLGDTQEVIYHKTTSGIHKAEHSWYRHHDRDKYHVGFVADSKINHEYVKCSVCD